MRYVGFFGRRSIRAGSIPRKILLLAILAIPLMADTKVKIASVPREYTPSDGSRRPELVSLQGFVFEIQEQTGRARVVIEYTYPNQPTLGLDGGPGPEPTTAQIAGLSYDTATKTVVYESAGKRVICGTLRNQKIFFWNRSSIKSTGTCKVRSLYMDQPEDTGWSIRRVPTIDTFFVVD